MAIINSTILMTTLVVFNGGQVSTSLNATEFYSKEKCFQALSQTKAALAATEPDGIEVTNLVQGVILKQKTNSTKTVYTLICTPK